MIPRSVAAVSGSRMTEPPATHGETSAPPRVSRATFSTSASAVSRVTATPCSASSSAGASASARDSRPPASSRSHTPRTKPGTAATWAPSSGNGCALAAGAQPTPLIAVTVPSARRTMQSRSPPRPQASGRITVSAAAAAAAASIALPPTRSPACTASGWPHDTATCCPSIRGRARRCGISRVCPIASATVGSGGRGSPVRIRHGPAAVRSVRSPRCCAPVTGSPDLGRQWRSAPARRGSALRVRTPASPRTSRLGDLERRSS